MLEWVAQMVPATTDEIDSIWKLIKDTDGGLVALALLIWRQVMRHFDERWENARKEQEQWRKEQEVGVAQRIRDQHEWRIELGHRFDLSDQRTATHFERLNGDVKDLQRRVTRIEIERPR